MGDMVKKVRIGLLMKYGLFEKMVCNGAIAFIESIASSQILQINLELHAQDAIF